MEIFVSTQKSDIIHFIFAFLFKCEVQNHGGMGVTFLFIYFYLVCEGIGTAATPGLL
jgi:hypothetical protein